MNNLNLKVIWIACVLLILNSMTHTVSAQNFLINTNADDCEVFVDDVKVGTGKSIKILLDKKHILKQIKVTRPGYFPMHEVAYYGDKEISINVTRKTYKSASGTSTIALKKSIIFSYLCRSMNLIKSSFLYRIWLPTRR